MTPALLKRPCPACRNETSTEEVHSLPRAEALTPEALRPHWRGLFTDKVFFSYHRCAGCGMLYAPTYFTAGQLGELYGDMAPNMELVPGDALAATQRGYWDAAKASAPLRGGYLEIGPDLGWVVKHAVAEGDFDRYWLFEPNGAVHPPLIAATSGKPHTISTEMEDLSAVPDGTVGLAVMVHVLDHMLDPIAALSRIHAKLQPGGVLMIVTHNEKSMLRSVMGKRWPPFCLQHPQLYNPASMTDLIRRAGYASATVARSKNYFPLAFLARQAAYAVGLKVKELPLPDMSIGLKLGNMITLARR